MRQRRGRWVVGGEADNTCSNQRSIYMISPGMLKKLITHLAVKCVRHKRDILLFTIAFSPALFLGLLIGNYAVNVPMWDDWERGVLLEKWHTGTLDLAYLFSPHIEHRIFFPRLLMLLLNSFSGGDLRWEMGATYCTVCFSSLAFFYVLRKTVTKSCVVYAVWFFLNLFFFSPMQWQNWLWGIQIAFMLPLCCLALVLVVYYLNLRSSCKLVLCFFLSILGTYSFSHGLLIWVVVFFLILFGERIKDRKLLFLSLWSLCFAGILLLYFSQFLNTSHSSHAYGEREGGPPPGLQYVEKALDKPGKTLDYFTGFLGNQFSRVPFSNYLEIAQCVGSMELGIFFLLTFIFLGKFGNASFRDRTLPWFALSAYAVSIALIVAISRVHIGIVERCLIPRYISISQYLFIGLVGVIAVIWSCWFKRGTESTIRWLQTLGIVLLTMLSTLQLYFWMYGIEKMKEWRVARLQSRVSLLFVNHFSPEHLNQLDGTLWFKKYARFLNEKGYLEPALLQEPLLRQFKKAKNVLAKSRGKFEVLKKLESGDYRASGYAELPKTGEPAHGVLLTYTRDDGAEVIFAVAEVIWVPSPSIVSYDYEFIDRRNLHKKKFRSWTKQFSPLSLPKKQKIEIKAWVVDSEKMLVRPLGQRFFIDNHS